MGLEKPIKKKIYISFDLDTLNKIDEMSHGKTFKSQYQVLMNCILKEALKNVDLIKSVFEKKAKENEEIEKLKKQNYMRLK